MEAYSDFQGYVEFSSFLELVLVLGLIDNIILAKSLKLVFHTIHALSILLQNCWGKDTIALDMMQQLIPTIRPNKVYLLRIYSPLFFNE
jgi:hypothetical protein